MTIILADMGNPVSVDAAWRRRIPGAQESHHEYR